MTDHEFWKRLDELSWQEMSAMREFFFQTVLKQGNEENKGILITCFYNQTSTGMVKQAFIEIDGGR